MDPVADCSPASRASPGVSEDDAYSEVADQQLTALEYGPDADLYNAVLDACELIFRLPEPRLPQLVGM